jgi:hypothetical protein
MPADACLVYSAQASSFLETHTMPFPSLLRRLTWGLEHRLAARLRRPKACHHPALRRPAVIPRVEALEPRMVLSTLTVLNNLDHGAGSLRDTIAGAVSGDTIAFAKSVRSITLTSGELAITQSLNIDGPGASKLTIDGGAAGRVFDIAGGATVSLTGLTIADGLADAGGRRSQRGRRQSHHHGMHPGPQPGTGRYGRGRDSQ